jgi:hypothetical protein
VSFLTTGAEPTPCKDGVSDPAIGGGGGAIGVATLVCAATGIEFASISSAIVASRTWMIIMFCIGPAPFCALAPRVDPGRSGAACHVNLTGGVLVFQSGFYHARCRCPAFSRGRTVPCVAVVDNAGNSRWWGKSGSVTVFAIEPLCCTTPIVRCPGPAIVHPPVKL